MSQHWDQVGEKGRYCWDFTQESGYLQLSVLSHSILKKLHLALAHERLNFAAEGWRIK